jgi:hypothetical protein
MKQIVADGRSQVAKRFGGGGVPAEGPGSAVSGLDPRLAAFMDTLHHRIAARARRLVYLYIPGVDYFGPQVGYVRPQAAAFYHAFAARNRVTLVDPLDGIRAEFARTGQPLHGFPNRSRAAGTSMLPDTGWWGSGLRA